MNRSLLRGFKIDISTFWCMNKDLIGVSRLSRLEAPVLLLQHLISMQPGGARVHVVGRAEGVPLTHGP